MTKDKFRQSIEDVIKLSEDRLKYELENIVFPKLETILRKISKSKGDERNKLIYSEDYMDLFRKLGLSHTFLYYRQDENHNTDALIWTSYIDCFLKGMEMSNRLNRD